MESLLARYLDGSLSEDEASAFLDAVGRDPELERELRAHETLLRDASRMPARAPSDGFADAVMTRVEREEKRASRTRYAWRRIPAPLAMAASVLVLLGAGYLAGRSFAPRPAPSDSHAGYAAGSGAAASAWTASLPGDDDLHVVRLVYRPKDSDVSGIAVAGSFNDWDPTTNVMQREGNLWSVILILPPGSYEYMFVENGDHWVSDPLAPRTRDDGFGGANAVLDVSA